MSKNKTRQDLIREKSGKTFTMIKYQEKALIAFAYQ